MKHIIQKYQEGGVVQPAVNTGIPQGGYAAPAIQNYLSGNSSGNTSGPLSYGAGSNASGVPDYHTLADSRRKLRQALAASGLSSEVQAASLKKADEMNTANIAPLAGSSGGGNYTTYGGHKDVAHENVNNAFATFGSESVYGKVNPDGTISTIDVTENPGYNAEMAAANPAPTAEDKKTMTPEEYAAASMASAGFKNVSGGYNANDPTTGFFGGVKDIYGGITSGIKNAVNKAPILKLIPGVNLASNLATAPISTYDPTPTLGYHNNDKDQDLHMASMMANAHHANNKDINASAGWYGTVGNTGGKVSYNNIGNNPPARNIGGPIGYNTGGISVANTGLREDEIRQRQMMQAQIAPQQQQAGPLSGIGEKVAMGAVNNGITNGLGALAAKEGIMGSLGSMLGGSAATGTAATAAAGGSAMMAALGPVGIGLGLGKLFGVFNKGGKVPYPKQKK